MRILIVSYWFPPYNSIGAVRVGKNAKYLAALRHDVRVLTAIGQTSPPVLKVELDHDRIIYTKWFDRMHLKYITEHPGNVPGASSPNISKAKHSKLYAALRLLYTNIVAYPDVHVGWYSPAVQEGIGLCKKWAPDIIYASALPYTSLLIAKQISDTVKVPWVAELRDLWTDNGEAAELVTRLNACFVSSDTLLIKQKLAFWLNEKLSKGYISAQPETCIRSLTRKDQASALSDFLIDFLPDHANNRDNRVIP